MTDVEYGRLVTEYLGMRRGCIRLANAVQVATAARYEGMNDSEPPPASPGEGNSWARIPEDPELIIDWLDSAAAELEANP
jgi:hypothetical protein